MTILSKGAREYDLHTLQKLYILSQMFSPYTRHVLCEQSHKAGIFIVQMEIYKQEKDHIDSHEVQIFQSEHLSTINRHAWDVQFFTYVCIPWRIFFLS
jgi:hypothetical protein